MTEIRVKVTYPDGEEDTFFIQSRRWDLSITEFYNMCRNAALAMDYPPKNVEELWGEE